MLILSITDVFQPIVDFISLIWGLIQDLMNGIVIAINFIKDLLLTIPNFLSSLPIEISALLTSALSIMIIIFIFKFVK